MDDVLKGWNRIEIIIQLFAEGVLGDDEEGEPVGVAAYVHSDFPGLAVALLPVQSGGYPRWTITHLQSGRMAGLWWWCFRQAILAVVAYCGGIDWTQPYEILRGKPVVEAVNNLLAEAANESRPDKGRCHVCNLCRPPGCNDRGGGNTACDGQAGGGQGAGGAP